MKKPFRLINVFRAAMVGAVALAVYFPVKNLPEASAGVATQSQVKLPQSIQLASAQTPWQAVFAAGY